MIGPTVVGLLCFIQFDVILNVTSHQDFEQLIPSSGENNLYNKYNHYSKKLNMIEIIFVVAFILLFYWYLGED